MTAAVGRVALERALLAAEGADARAVLQSVVTNDLEQVAPGRAVYAALLTPQGKYLFDFFLVEAEDGRLLIDTEATRAEALARRLKMYCLRRDARIVPAEGLGVALIWGEGVPVLPGAVPDPREAGLGWRLYTPDPEGALAAVGLAEGTAQDYTAQRIALGVPEGGLDLIPEETFILEAGFERLHGVDFRKGCYVGQEVTARMKHKTTLRKGLVRVALDGEAAPGTPILTEAGKPAGTLYSTAGGAALAHLRFDRAVGALSAGAAQVFYTPPEEPEAEAVSSAKSAASPAR
ncbi:MAG: folate-binding protein [Pseudomonadota bacterium]